MTILKDVFSELLGMFLGDAWLSGAALAVVAVTAVLIDLAHIDPLIGGGVLLIGCLAVVLVTVCLAARSQGVRNGAVSPGRAGNPRAISHPGETNRDGLLGRIRMWPGRLRQRRDLKGLDDRLLDDIGVGRDAAEAESRRFD
ncbi:MAG: DUF1127 domain-containing protein [Haliea sp.]